MYRSCLLVIVIILSMFSASPVVCIELQLIAGAGPSTKITTVFFNNFQTLPEAAGYKFEVPPRSTKHAGGIQASGKYLFGRTGRPLKKEEKALGKDEIILGRIPLSFVAGSGSGVKEVSRRQLTDMIKGKITTWNEVGGSDHKILLVGREETEASLTVLVDEFPCLAEANYEIVFKRDHQVVNFLKSEQANYALAFGAKANFDPKYHLRVDGFSQGINVGLVYDLKNQKHPVVVAVKNYATSKPWQNAVLLTDYLIASDTEIDQKKMK